MDRESGTLPESRLAAVHVAHIWTILIVGVNVFLQVLFPSKHTATNGALMWSVTLVHH